MTTCHSNIWWEAQWLTAKGCHDLKVEIEKTVIISVFHGWGASVAHLHTHKDGISNVKYAFSQVIKWGFVKMQKSQLKLTHVFSGLTKDNNQQLNLHTNYCIFLSRGWQPVKRNLLWGIVYGVHTGTNLISCLLYLFPFLLSRVIVNHQASLCLD